MNSRANDRFWKAYQRLPPDARVLARRTYRLWRQSPHHPSLHFKKVASDTWCVRIGIHYRALATEEEGVFIWFWIGNHTDYEHLLAG